MSDVAVEIISPTLKLAGRELDPEWMNRLLEVRVELEFRVPGRISLRFWDDGYSLLQQDKVKLGDPIILSVTQQSTIIEAEVTGIATEQQVGEQPELVIIAHDKAHRLGRATRVETYLQSSYSDIVSLVASNNGMTGVADSTSLTLEYLLQVDSDMELLNEMADRCGFDWWAEGSKLMFKKPGAGDTVGLQLNSDLLAFSVRANGHRPDKVKVDGWDRKKQEAVTGSTDASETELKPESNFADLVDPSKKPFGEAIVQTASLSAGSPDEAMELSKAIVARAVAASVTAKGVCDGTAKIKPGVTVDVRDAGPLSGKYHVTRVEHTYRTRTGFQTRFVAGDRTPTTLVDTLGGSRRSAALAGSFDHPGLVVGQVTNINDPDKLGRIKVRYPGLSSEEESQWGRLCILGGGKDRGQVFIPEVNDEVLVGFESGDLRQPVIIGGLYGDKSGIPKWAVDDGKVSARQITSRLGHTLTLSDGDDGAQQFVSIVLAGEEHKLRLGKDKTELEIPSGQELTIKAGDTKIAFTTDGSINIEGQNITLKAKQNIKLESQMDTEVKAQMNLKLDGTMETKLHGLTVGVEADTEATIKGNAMVQIN